MHSEDLVFARGFLLCRSDDREAKQVIPKHWKECSMGEQWSLFYHGWTSFSSAVTGDANVQVVLLGYAIHIFNEKYGEALANHLASAVKSGREILQEELDSCAGRYLVIIQTDKTLYIQQDAIGLRAVYFSSAWTHRQLVSSHDKLIARAIQSPPSPFAKADYRKNNSLIASPGNTTLFNGVQRITPNLQLVMPEMKLVRFYPHASYASADLENTYELLTRATDVQLKWWTSSQSPFNKIFMSLSGGFDSRASLALVRPHRDKLSFFTYRKRSVNKYSNRDEEASAQLVEKFSLPHDYLELDEIVVYPETKRAAIHNTHFSHPMALAQAYLEFMPTNSLHIRSNAYEIVRAHYRKIGFNADHLHARAMNHIAYSGKNADPFSEAAFAQWRVEAQWEEVERQGYDPLDFFYWEYRMGVWLTGHDP